MIATKSKIRKRELRDLKTSWLETGNTTHPILVFLHGYPDEPTAWRHQIEHFANRFQVICPFSRGLLPSDLSTSLSRFNRKSLSLDILQILKIVDPDGAKPVLCVGHDLGAVVAWYLAPLLGPRLKGLVIINGLSLEQMGHRLLFRPKQLLKSWYIYPMLLPRLPEFIATHFPDQLTKVANRLGEKDPGEAQEFSAGSNPFAGPLNQYRAFLAEMLRPHEQVTKIHSPTLIVWGSRDAFILPPTIDEVEPYASDFAIRILEGNHWVHQSQAGQVNKILDAFFEKSSS